jgi:hypothetical protein
VSVGGRNPFEAPERAALDQVFALPAAVRAAVESGARCLQFVGACGQGKTTHLLALAAWLSARGEAAAYDLIGLDGAAQRPVRGWWLVDESQRWSRARLRAEVGGALAGGLRVALGTHRSHRRALTGVVAVESFWLRALDEQAMRHLLGRYLAAAGREPDALGLSPAGARRLNRACRGRVEWILRTAYELCEDGAPPAGEAQVDAALRRLRRDAPTLFAREAR